MILDFLTYKEIKKVVILEESDEFECIPPFHGYFFIKNGPFGYYCNECQKKVDLIFHPSSDGGLWLERKKDTSDD